MALGRPIKASASSGISAHSPLARPIFIDRLPDTPAHVAIAQSPKGWVGQWHENPAAQWIITLSGHWFIETMDGHRVEMGPGDVSLGEDQGAEYRRSCRALVGYTRRRAPHPDVRSVGSQSDPQRRLLELYCGSSFFSDTT